jgi:hypothetical protein
MIVRSSQRACIPFAIALCAVCWQVLSAAAVPYDIVYVRAPRAGDNTHVRWAEVARPMFVEPGSDLMLLHANGTEEVLVAAGKGAVADPCVSFDAQWIYYSYFTDLSSGYWIGNNTSPLVGADVYKVNLASRQIVQLTHGEYTPNTSVRTSPLPYGVYNMGPCPVAGGKVVFTSNRNGFIPPKQYTPVTSQLFIMNEDGSDVRPIAPMTLGAALHPFQLKDGRIAFSTQEAQGMRDQRAWALWSIWPDGRHWEPLHSAFTAGSAFHFATQLSQGDIVVEDYYNLNNLGFGTLHRFPTNVSAPGFYSARRAENPPAVYTNVSGERSALYYPFAPVGFQTITPFSTMIDQSSGLVSAGSSDRLGKVTHPSAAPNNDLLLVYASGPVNLLARPVNLPAPDAGIYLARNGGPVERPGDLVLVKNDPLYNEIWPRAVVPYRAIHGVDQPHVFPFLPNDGAVPSLPAGTPYGIIGTSSFYKRESFPGWATPGLNYDGIEPFNAPGEDLSPGWGIQGSDAGKYTNADISAVRILMMEPQTEMSGLGGKKFFNHINERMRILGEVPVRKTAANGSPVLDPEGNPDTSFWAKIPADTPVTFQMLDKDGRVLAMAQTWHQVRPGEVRVDCGGCHAHSQMPLAFENTAAARLPPTDLTLQPAHDVEYVRDIEPLVQAKCVSCHRGDNAPAQLRLDRDTATNYSVLANNKDSQYGGIKPPAGAYQTWLLPNVSRYVRVLQSRRSLLMWKLAGARLDGWTNEQWPTTIFANPTEARYLFDLDYERGTVDHAALLTDQEKRRVATWIDLAAPLDLGGGYWRDELRPTLSVTVVAGELLIGAADAYSGLDASSLSVTVNGAPAALQSRGGGVWAGAAPPGAVVVAKVKDRAGNWNELTSRVAGGVVAPRAPTGVRVVPGQ